MALIRCCFEPVELPEFFDTFVQKCTDPTCKYITQLLFAISRSIGFLYLRSLHVGYTRKASNQVSSK